METAIIIEKEEFFFFAALPRVATGSVLRIQFLKQIHAQNIAHTQRRKQGNKSKYASYSLLSHSQPQIFLAFSFEPFQPPAELRF